MHANGSIGRTRLIAGRAVWFRILVGIVGLALLAGACGTDDDPAVEEPEPGEEENGAEDQDADDNEDAAADDGDGPIIIGVANSFEGFMNFYDEPVRGGVEIAVDEINEGGGLLGRQLEIVYRNNATDLSLVEPVTLEVIEAGADLVIPTCTYDIAAPAARVAQEHGVLAIGCAGGHLYGYEGIGPLLFNSHPGSATEAAALAEFAHAKGLRNPYILEDTLIEYTRDVARFFRLAWVALEGEDSIVGEDTFTSEDESISGQISRMAAAQDQADFVVVASLPPGGASAVRQMRAGGIDLPMYGSGAFDGRGWIDAVPDLSDFYHPAHGSIWGDDPVEERQAFFDEYEERFGPPPSATYPILGYANVQTFAIGVERAGTTDARAVADEIAQFNEEPLLSGRTTYSEECRIPLGRELVMIEFQDGQASYADTVNVANVPEEAAC